MENQIHLYNNLTRQKELFIPIDARNIRLYSCGPTVYHYVHLGNLRAYVFADILNEVLTITYPESVITHVINITDVGHNVGDGDDGEDKLEKGSKREGKSVWDVAKMYTEAFFKDLEALNINIDKYIFPRATDYIKEQIKLVQQLEERGYTYRTSDGIYFDTSKFASYADFARLDVKNLSAGERVDMGEKRNKTDFALWKFSPTDVKRQMEWDSPWGMGFPGWHIECSAMSEALLGEHFDIHTGGIDHIPVHHTNEIAQSVCAHDGRPYVNYWLHNNFLNDASGKMSKSNDDFLRLETIIRDGYTPSHYKYLLYNSSYRSEINFSYESLDAAKNALTKLQKWLHNEAKNLDNIQDATKYRINEDYYDNFLAMLRNDLNTAGALAVLWEMIKDRAPHAYATVLAMNRILNLDISYQEEEIELSEEDKIKVEELIAKRKLAKENKDYQVADEIREELKKYGVNVTD